MRSHPPRPGLFAADLPANGLATAESDLRSDARTGPGAGSGGNSRAIREDLAIRVRGQVQGVGFRPFVWQLAQAHGVTGRSSTTPRAC
jgi:hypothetical protein